MYKFEVDFGSVAAHGETGEKALLQRMADTIVHRGPDDAGYWCAVDQGIGLDHRRPSIVGRLERTGV
jgi:asparagine synthase (glutamine-hydrolysing)